jgi:hypothetical protein
MFECISNASVARVENNECTGSDFGGDCGLAELTADPSHFIRFCPVDRL